MRRLLLLLLFLLAACQSNTPPVHIPNLPIMAADAFAFSRQILDVIVHEPTVIQFGADGRLYLGQSNGTIMALSFNRYTNGLIYLEDFEEISTILTIPNHNDEGIINTQLRNRLIMGIASAGTAQNPILYISSSDPRIARAENQGRVDSNSGIISRLIWTGDNWEKIDIVRGLPRSFRNHASNGLYFDSSSNMLYLAQGSNTNMGAASSIFFDLPEYPYSAAIVQIDLTMLATMPIQLDTNGQAFIYDLPTLDDPSRENDAQARDINDPFGGNHGANQAILNSDGPVQIFASGFRNPREILRNTSGFFYTVDTGASLRDGAYPENCGNNPSISNYPYHLHLVTEGLYAGHPNPSRSECQLLTPPDDGALISFPDRVLGFAEYQSNHFAGALNGALLFPSINGYIYYTFPKANGQIHPFTDGESLHELAAALGEGIVDIAVSPEGTTLAGTIWLIKQNANQIITLSPIENYHCDPEADGDTDRDSFDTEDEITAGTNPCSANSSPAD